MNPTTTVPKYKIPTYHCATKLWSHTYFQTNIEFRTFLLPLFKEPGQYNFNNDSNNFNNEGKRWNRDRYYCAAARGTRDYKKYWDGEKEKNKEGVIFIGENDTWYVPRDYYMWLNFLPIFNKEKNDILFPDIYDTQYHVALYERLAELHYKHGVMLKKRQIAMSYYHAAKLINLYWFERGVTLKLLGSLDSYINEEGTWAFLQEYRDFLNQHTAWYRPSEPDKVKSWQQRIQVETKGRKTYKGRKNRLLGISTQQSPTKGVGGASKLVCYEEYGIAPTGDKSYFYVKPALEIGLITTGFFVGYGSVGDLHQCEPLKKFMFKPKENGFYAVSTDLVDSKGTIKDMGLFIPEQWSMPPYIDQFGNSVIFTPTPAQAADIRSTWVEKTGLPIEDFDPARGAYQALMEKRVHLKADLTPEDYQLEISQHPTTIEEAFKWREESIFPPEHVSTQRARIAAGEYPKQFIELSDDNEKGVITSKISFKLPITEFPVPKKMVNKEGVLVVFERPDPNPKWGMYTASIDPVAEGKTITSNSLCSIVVYKNPIERIKHNADGTIKPYLEGDKIVATWCGRFDDIKKTHKMLELIIRWYNAWTICEANVSLFINYMIEKNYQHYLVPKDQMLFLKELSGNNGYHEFGWKNTGVMFKSNLLSYGVEFLSEELSVEYEENGDVNRIHFGVERIPDDMILVEMDQYRPGLNVDRLISYCALIAFVRIQYASRGALKIIEYAKKLENPLKNTKLIVTPFRNMGGHNNSKLPAIYRVKRSGFRNIK